MEKVQRSNEACQRGDFQAAVGLYGEALLADPQNCILYSNRSAALLKLGQHRAALEDAEKACLLNPKWPKDPVGPPPPCTQNKKKKEKKKMKMEMEKEKQKKKKEKK
ncbi:unnamed protein product [Arctogadus glacialis]